MTDADLDARLAVAIDAVRAGGACALTHFRALDGLAVERKGLQDLVSAADREVEAVIRERLGRAFPEDGLLGEEEGGTLAEHLWVIDPIDGTANFLRGMPYWSVVLAFAVAGAPVIGITYDPVHDELFTSVRGRGARRNDLPIRVSGRTDPLEACVGLSYSFKTEAGAYERLIRDLLAARLDHRRMGSSALSLCHVADGRLDALVCLACNSWDVLAGLHLVQEAGGIATPYAEGASLLDRRAVAAATPGLEGLIAELTGLPLRPAERR
jgi:myo-inositol-1(or 4)-monophosphatase